MKLASVIQSGTRRLGVVDVQRDIVSVFNSGPDVDAVVRGHPGALEAVQAGLSSAKPIPLSEARLASPLSWFNRDILCTGWNYWDHFEESKGKREGQDPDGRPTHPPSSPRAPTP